MSDKNRIQPKPTLHAFLQQPKSTTPALVFVETAAHAQALAAADIDWIALDPNLDVASMRALVPNTLLAASLAPWRYSCKQGLREAAFACMHQGADALVCPLAPEAVDTLTREGIPVIAQLKLQDHLFGEIDPDTGVSQVRAKEAFQLYKQAKSCRSAGALAIILSQVPPKVAAKITNDLGLFTFSDQSGTDCNGIASSAKHLLGIEKNGFAKAYRKQRDVLAELNLDAKQAFLEFRSDLEKNRFSPKLAASATSDDDFETFVFALEKSKKKKA